VTDLLVLIVIGPKAVALAPDGMTPFVAMVVLLSAYKVLEAGNVTKTFLVPAGKSTKLPELLEDSTVSRERVVPLEV
jgi:hypothetical protein